jgi:cytochrome P450
MLGDPLAWYVRLAARYGDAVRVPFAPRRALVGNGLLTSEGEAWRRHRRLIQPVFSRREVSRSGPYMAAAARRLGRAGRTRHWSMWRAR